MADGKYIRLSPGVCGFVAQVADEKIRRKQLRDYTGCDHPKPLFANGKERRFCYDCSPKPEPKPRRAYTLKVERRSTCANQRCCAEFIQTHHAQLFCCSKCANAPRNRDSWARRRNGSERPCRHCGKRYTPEYGSLRRYYCTLDCRRKAKNLRGNGNTHRRRAKKYGVPYTPVSRIKVFERDGWKCYLCGRDTPRVNMGTDEPNAPELEHMVPLSRGGSHSYENTRCACRLCNRIKGDRTDEEVGGSKVHQ